MSDEWVLVPKVPTEAMLLAASRAPDDDDWLGAMAKAYAALLAAAPSPPVSVEQAGKATAEQIEAGLRAAMRVAPKREYMNAGGGISLVMALSRGTIEAAIDAALQLVPANGQ